MNKEVLIISLIILSVFPLASASVQSSTKELSCRLDFNIGVVNSLISAVPNDTSLKTALSTLESEKTKISSFTNNTEYSSFVKGQYQSDMQQVRNSVSSWRKINLKALSISEKAALASSYSQLKIAFDQCENDKWKTLAQERLENYQNEISKYQNASARFSSKGFDASAMNSLISDAQAQIIQPLQSALSSASSSKEISGAVQKYCLFDNCKNGTNFHLAAKFDVAKFGSIYSTLQANATTFNLNSTDLAQVKSSLSDAQSVLTSVGTLVYTQAQESKLSKDFKSISSALNHLISQTNKSAGGNIK